MQYHWGENSTIKHVEVHPQKGNRYEALVYAPDAVSAEALSRIPEQLQARGLNVSPDVVDGEHVLRVRGKGNGADVVNHLQSLNLVQDAASVSSLPKKEGKQPGLMDKFRKSSLRIAGIFYIVGDVALLAAGRIRAIGNNEGGGLQEMGTGIAFGLSDVLMAIYGHKDGGRELTALTQKMQEFLRQEGVELPQHNALTAEAIAKSGMLHKIDSFLHKELIPIKSVFEIVGGALYVQAGQKSENKFKMFSGAAIIAGFVTSLLIPEKKHTAASRAANAELADMVSRGETPPQENEGFLNRMYNWVHERPLRVTGPLALANNVSLMIGGWQEEKNKTKLMDKRIENLNSAIETYNDMGANSLGRMPVPKRDTQQDNDQWKKEVQSWKTGFTSKIDRPNQDLQAVNTAYEKVVALEQATNPIKSVTVMGHTINIPDKINTPYRLNLVGTGLPFLIANTTLTLSSKETQNGGVNKELEDLFTLGAVAYQGLPEADRVKSINGYAGCLARELGYQLSAREIADKIQDKCKQLESSPWVNKLAAQAAQQPAQGASIH